jgi:hypothetical protein
MDGKQLRAAAQEIAADALAASRAAGNSFIAHLTGRDWLVLAVWSVLMVAAGYLLRWLA